MSDYDMSGILFQNDRKAKENQPDYQGKISMHGVEYRLAGWKKQGRNGPFLTLKVSLPQDKPVPEKSAQKAAETEFTDDIPF